MISAPALKKDMLCMFLRLGMIYLVLYRVINSFSNLSAWRRAGAQCSHLPYNWSRGRKKEPRRRSGSRKKEPRRRSKSKGPERDAGVGESIPAWDAGVGKVFQLEMSRSVGWEGWIWVGGSGAMKSHRPWPIKAGRRGTGASTLHSTPPLQQSTASLHHCRIAELAGNGCSPTAPTGFYIYPLPTTPTQTGVGGTNFSISVTIGQLLGQSQLSPGKIWFFNNWPYLGLNHIRPSNGSNWPSISSTWPLNCSYQTSNSSNQP